MKKIIAILMVLCSCSLSYGKTVSLNDAKTVGFNYLTQRGAAITNINDLNLVYTSGSAPAYFYVFGNAKCFVVVAAEDAVTPVIGYSKSNSFRGDHLPAQITEFFASYNNQIDYVISNHVAATGEIATQWQNLANNVKQTTAAKTTDVSPMLVTTWDQYPNYNALCPADATAAPYGGTDVTGCVATAMAQVMKFWNWPVTGSGSNSYGTTSYGTLSSDFSASTYNWTAMPNSLSGPNVFVARLMYDAGVSVDMDYTSNESGAYVISASTFTPPYCAEYALKTFFGYSSSLHGESRGSYSDATWISMLQASINAGEPVIYSGFGSVGGHCFVFDGYETTGSMFHVNWGWSGSSDGYYTVDALNPPALGAGGGSGGFNSGQDAIFGIKPANTVIPAGLSLASNVTPSATSITAGSPFTITTSITNGAATAFNGSYGALVYDATDNLVDSVQVLSGSLAAGATSGTLTFSTAGSVNMLPGASYTVVIYDRTAGGTWSMVNGSASYINAAYITVQDLAPDVYEINNIPVSAHNLTSTLNWVSDVASTGTPGSNFHYTGDEDYYKIILPAGYRYTISARVNDVLSTDDGLVYSTDAQWSYSTNGGSTWSATYNDVMPGTISVTGPGSVMFHCSLRGTAGVGTYLLKIGNITRVSTEGVANVGLSNAHVFPNPASDVVNIDLSGTNAKGTEATITDMEGRNVYTAKMNNQVTMQVPVSSLAAGIYFITVTTDLGEIREKITVGK